MFKMVLILRIAFVLSIAEATEVPQEPLMALRCEAVMRSLPQADLVPDWRRDMLPEYFVRAHALNDLLPLGRHLSNDQIRRVVTHLLVGDIEEWLQLQEIFEHLLVDGQVIPPDYLNAVHSWFKGLAERPIPVQIEKEDKRSRLSQTLNPIQMVRYELLKDALAYVERGIGQPLHADSEMHLKNWAQRAYLTDDVLKAWSQLALRARPYNIVSYQNKLSKIRSHLRDGSGVPYGLSNEQIVMKLLDDETIRREIDAYAAYVKTHTGTFFEERVIGWILGEPTMKETILRVVARKVLQIFDVFAQGGPSGGYVGPAYLYSFYEQMQREKMWENREALELFLDSLKDAKWDVTHLGRWEYGVEFSGMPKLGIPLVRRNQQVETFSVTLRVGDSTHEFAVMAEMDWKGRSPLSIEGANYLNLQSVEVTNIKRLARPARSQDAFRTTPIDLAEPLVRREQGENREMPESLLITHLPLSISDQKSRSESELMFEAANIAGRAVFSGDLLPEKYIVIHFNSGTTSGGPLRLAIVEESTGRQVFEIVEKTSAVTRTNYRLTRNLLTGTFELEVTKFAGALGIWGRVSQKTARYR